MRGAVPTSSEGDAATAVVLATFRANGLLLAAGDVLAAEDGLTSARWQVLGAIVLAERPLTVPQIARRMGLTRQSVQASVNRLRADGLVQADHNPDHLRSPLIRLTELGREKYAALDRRQSRWIDELSAGIEVDDLSTAGHVLEELARRLEANAPERRKG
jgi:DNA-binding MarR family transcriptional regulator